MENIATEPVKVDANPDLFPAKAKEDNLKTAPSLSPSSKSSLDFKKPEPKEKKSLTQLVKQSKLEEYLPMMDSNYDTEELYKIRACDLDTRLQEIFPFLKNGHRGRLGVIVLEGKRIKVIYMRKENKRLFKGKIS